MNFAPIVEIQEEVRETHPGNAEVPKEPSRRPSRRLSSVGSIHGVKTPLSDAFTCFGCITVSEGEDSASEEVI